MDIETVWGVTWRSAGKTELLIVFFLIFIVSLIVFILKYYQRSRDKQIHDKSLFLFKMKKIGFSVFQVKVINNIVDTVHLKNPNFLFTNSSFFESAAVKFFHFLKKSQEGKESLLAIARELVIIYDKLYCSSDYQKPLNSIFEVEKKHILYFVSKKNNVYLSKIEYREDDYLILKLLRYSGDLSGFEINNQLKIYIVRFGDAEYMFEATIKEIDKDILKLKFASQIEKETEFRHPYVDAFFHANILKTKIIYEEDMIEVKSLILKLNDYESILKVQIELDYNIEYFLVFEIMDFKMKIRAKIISKKVVEEDNTLHYTFKYLEMSEAAKKVIKNYMYQS